MKIRLFNFLGATKRIQLVAVPACMVTIQTTDNDAFDCWVPNILQQCDHIIHIAAIKSFITDQKYGIETSHSG
jgi:hypothetical protein